MAAVENNPEPRVEPSQGPKGGSVPADKRDAKGQGKPASQGDNPNDRYDSEGVTPVTLEPSDTEIPPAAGSDPDSVARAAKAQLGAGHSWGDDVAEEQVGAVAKARALIDERNSAVAERVKAIDAELEGLGFTPPVATTEAQRRGEGPAGRHSGQQQQG
jgi:hypothetical protein